MADIVNKIDRGIPVNERYQIFTASGINDGDIILVKDSLGKSAAHVTIESVGGMSVRLNVYHTIFPDRQVGDGMDADNMGFQGPNVSQGVTYKDDSQGIISIPAAGAIEFDSDLPINDIEIVAATDEFTITCI